MCAKGESLGLRRLHEPLRLAGIETVQLGKLILIAGRQVYYQRPGSVPFPFSLSLPSSRFSTTLHYVLLYTIPYYTLLYSLAGSLTLFTITPSSACMLATSTCPRWNRQRDVHSREPVPALYICTPRYIYIMSTLATRVPRIRVCECFYIFFNVR